MQRTSDLRRSLRRPNAAHRHTVLDRVRDPVTPHTAPRRGFLTRVGAPLATRIVAALERRRFDAVLAHVRGRLLDIGCGENRLVRRYGNGIGVDVYDWGDVDLIVEDTTHLPFADRSFDTISFVACLNHIPNRAEVLREAYRLLKDDGLLLITMISPGLSQTWHRVVAPWDADQTQRGMKAGEVWGLTSAQIYELVRGAGFRVTRQRKFILGLNNVYVAAKNVEA